MFGENKDKLLKASERSLISEDLTIEGSIVSPGDIDLAGSIKGPVNVNELNVKESGSLIGEVKAETVEVAGFIDGKIIAQNVIITSTGEVKGDIEFTDILRTEDGATVDGYVKKVSTNKETTVITDFLSKSKDTKKSKKANQ